MPTSDAGLGVRILSGICTEVPDMLPSPVVAVCIIDPGADAAEAPSFGSDEVLGESSFGIDVSADDDCSAMAGLTGVSPCGSVLGSPGVGIEPLLLVDDGGGMGLGASAL